MTDKPNYSLKDLLNELKEKENKLEIVEEDYDNCRLIRSSVARYLYIGSDDEKYEIRCFYDKQKLKAEISALKKGISACEEIKNNSWKFICTKCRKESITDIRGKEKYLCYECALEQKEKEILEKIDKCYQELECSDEVYNRHVLQTINYIHNELKQQLNSQQHEDLPAMGRTEVSLGNGNPKHNSPADTQFQNNLNNTSTNLNLNKGCEMEFVCFDKGRMGRRTICGEDGYYCDKCKLKAVKNES